MTSTTCPSCGKSVNFGKDADGVLRCPACGAAGEGAAAAAAAILSGAPRAGAEAAARRRPVSPIIWGLSILLGIAAGYVASQAVREWLRVPTSEEEGSAEGSRRRAAEVQARRERGVRLGALVKVELAGLWYYADARLKGAVRVTNVSGKPFTAIVGGVRCYDAADKLVTDVAFSTDGPLAAGETAELHPRGSCDPERLNKERAQFRLEPYLDRVVYADGAEEP